MRNYLPPERNGGIASAHLLELLRQLYPTAETAPPPTRSLLTAVQAASKTSPGETLPCLAKRLGISESHLRARHPDTFTFNRAFRRGLGRPPSAVLNAAQ